MRLTTILFTLFMGLQTVAQTQDRFDKIVNAIENNNTEYLDQYFIAESTINKGMINMPDDLDRHYAKDEFKYLQFLYENGYIKLNSRMILNKTIIDVACLYNETEFIQTVLADENNRKLRFNDGSMLMPILLYYSQFDLILPYITEIPKDFHDNKNNNIFYYCRKHTTAKAIEYFRNLGCDMVNENNIGNDIFYYAVNEGNKFLVDYLLNNDYKYLPQSNRMLRRSLHSKNSELIRLFAREEKNFINERDYFGSPILNSALQWYYDQEIDTLKEIITILIKNGYDINAYDADGHNVLAECDRNVELFEFLIDVGVRKKFSDESQQTLEEFVFYEFVLAFAIGDTGKEGGIIVFEDLLISYRKLKILGEDQLANQLLQGYEKTFYKGLFERILFPSSRLYQYYR